MNIIEKISNPRKAMTNNIHIKGDIKDNILKILNENISVNIVKIKFNDKREKDYKKMHLDIKEAIADELNIKKQEVKNYETYIAENKCYFFYLNNKKNNNSNFIQFIEKHNLNLEKIFGNLVNLSLKFRILEDIEKSGLLIPLNIYNSKLYINSIPHKNKNKSTSYVDTFELNMFFSKFNCLVFNLISKTFKYDPDQDISLDNCLILETTKKDNKDKDKKYEIDIDKSVNAIKFNKTNYIDFGEKYHETKNYSENYILKRLQEILDCYKIEYENVIFNPELMSTKFLNYEPNLTNKTIVIDNYEYNTENEESDFYNQKYKSKFHKNIKESLERYGIKSTIKEVNDKHWWKELDDSFNYIVINKESENGNSIIHYDNGNIKYLDNFEEALEIYKKNKNYSFDSYTNLKIFNHNKNNRLVIQGCDIEDLYIIDQNGEISFKEPFKFTSKKEKPKEEDYNNSTIKKISYELWLKEQIFRNKILTDFNIKDGKYNIYYTRKKGKHKTKLTIHVLEIEVLNKELIIKEYRQNDNKIKIKKEENKYQILKKSYYKEFNDTFCIYDVNNEELLTVYNNGSVPRIIGNPNFNNFDLYNQKGKLHRGSKEDCVLPFMINPKRKSIDSKKGNLNIISIEDKKEYTDIYVTSKIAVQNKISKSNLIYRTYIINKNGERISSIGNKLFDFFLMTHIEDVVLINDASRSSLMKKIIKEFSN